MTAETAAALKNTVYDFLEQHQYAEAEQAAKALRELPEEVVCGQQLLVSVYIEAGSLALAQGAAEQLLALIPQEPYALFLQLRVRFLAGERVSLIGELTRLSQQKKQLAPTLLEKVYNLLGQCCRAAGDSRRSTEAYRLAVGYAADRSLKAAEYSNYLFNLHYLDLPAQKVAAAHRRYAELFDGLPQFVHRRRSQTQKKLRIGYISPDIRNHVVLRFSYALFAGYDHARYEVWCYARSPEDGWSRRVMKLVDGWRNFTGMPDEAAARLIYEDGIDILFDLSGHTQGNCLPILAYRPAPIQISGIGYFATTGLPMVDYVLGDRYLDEVAAGREAAAEQVMLCRSATFTERLLVLPHSHFCYTALGKAPEPSGTPCRQKGYVTFGSFNNFTKVTDAVMVAWSQVLARVPGSRLLLKAQLFNREDGRKQAAERLAKHGIDLSRVELRGFSRQYLSEYHEVDIALDTFPYPGGGTTCDALWMGVPVVTLIGKTHGERFGYSILANAGLEELCCRSEAEYVERAAALAGDVDTLEALHRNLRRLVEHSTLMDVQGYLEAVEQGYELIWQEYLRQQPVPAYREIAALLPRMAVLAEQHDWRQAMALADGILAARPDNRHALELAAGVYIDGQDAAGIDQAMEQLLAVSGEYGYGCFLQARAAYLHRDWRAVERNALRGLELGGLEPWQQGLLYNLLGRVYKELGEAGLAIRYSRQAIGCVNGREAKAAEYSNYLFNLCYRPLEPPAMRQAAEGFQALFADVQPFVHVRRNRHAKLRIGYLSPDFCFHVVAYFSYALVHDYDHHRFAVTCYANCAEDSLSGQFKALADHWCNISQLPPQQAAQRIYEDEIDILFDLSGHTQRNCLPILAYRPAPVQLSGIGFMGTTGLAAVDYFLGDRYTDTAVLPAAAPLPEEAEKGLSLLGRPAAAAEQVQIAASPDFTERLLLLPHSHLCYASIDAPRHAYPAPCRQKGYVTFGSFNNFTKTTDAMLALWAQILAQVPGSRLFLKAAIFNDAYGKEKAMARLAAAGIPLARLKTGRQEAGYLAAYGEVDIALDTFLYPGGGTTCDALYMGVPVITLVGESHNARFGYSLLMNAGLPECCAASPAEYVAKAVALAADTARLAELHQTLRRRFAASPAMDAGLYMTELESAYDRIWEDWLRGEAEPDGGEIQREMAEMTAALKAGDWETVVQRATRLVGQGAQDTNILSSAAFAYYQLTAWYPALFWLRRAMARSVAGLGEHYFMLGGALRETVHHVEAREAYAAAVHCLQAGTEAVDPVLLFKSWMLLALQYFVLGDPADTDAYRQACEAAPELRDRCNMYSSRLLTLNSREVDEAELFQLHCGYAKLLAAAANQPYVHQPPVAGHVGRKLRIGYISPDFRRHVMYYFYYQFLAGYDHEQFTVICYDLNASPDDFTATLTGLVDGWRDVSGKPYAEIARQIKSDSIDILFDLAGHSANSGLPVLAWKPAPVQLSGLGYMATTGLSAVDYFLTDNWADPVGAGHEVYFTEKLLRLRSQFCYTGRSDVPKPQGAAAKGRGWVLFGVFNHYRKITDEMLLAWREILARVPKSRLLLKSQVLVSASAAALAYERLKGLGFDMDRVWLEPATSDYMERYLDVDIALDTYPYPGGGTTCDALYMGVPVISRYGSRHSSRFGLSVLQGVGLGELAVDSVPAYIERATALAGDMDLLDALHQRLRNLMLRSPLMDARGYVQELEQAYRRIWQEYEQGR